MGKFRGRIKHLHHCSFGICASLNMLHHWDARRSPRLCVNSVIVSLFGRAAGSVMKGRSQSQGFRHLHMRKEIMRHGLLLDIKVVIHVVTTLRIVLCYSSAAKWLPGLFFRDCHRIQPCSSRSEQVVRSACEPLTESVPYLHNGICAFENASWRVHVMTIILRLGE